MLKYSIYIFFSIIILLFPLYIFPYFWMKVDILDENRKNITDVTKIYSIEISRNLPFAKIINDPETSMSDELGCGKTCKYVLNNTMVDFVISRKKENVNKILKNEIYDKYYLGIDKNILKTEINDTEVELLDNEIKCLINIDVKPDFRFLSYFGIRKQVDICSIDGKMYRAVIRLYSNKLYYHPIFSGIYINKYFWYEFL